MLRKKQKKYLEGKIYQYSGESLEKEERVSVEDDFLDENRVLAPFVFNWKFKQSFFLKCLYASTPWLHLNTYIFDGNFEQQVAFAAFDKSSSKYLRSIQG